MNKLLIFLILGSFILTVNTGTSCPLYCNNCNDQGYCLLCNSPFNLNDKGLCQVSNTIEGCQIYSSELNKNNCVKCVNDQILINGKCSKMPKNCAEIDETSDCKKCLSEFELIGTSCLSKYKAACPPGHFPYQNYCRPYQIMNCVQKKQGYCQMCQKGYSLLNGACIPQGCVVTKCDGCICKGTVMNKNCFDCKPDNCIQSQNGFHCDICESSYVPINGICYKPVKYDDVNCNLVDEKGQTCTGCNNDYKLDRNNYCVRDFIVNECSANRFFDYFEGRCFYKDRNCDKIDSKTYQCQYCAQGYTLRAGKCERTEKCLRKNNNECFQCMPQFYLHPVKKTCEQKPRNCMAVNTDLNQCSKCKQPTSLTNLSLNNRVICASPIQPRCSEYNYEGSCISCMSGFILKNRICVSKAQFCQQPHPTDPTLCTKCQSGYKMQDSKCYQQSVGCTKFGNDGKCVRCLKDWILVNGRCSFVDKYCLQIDDQGNCMRCSQGLLPFADKCVYYQPYCAGYGLDRMCNKTYAGFNLKSDISASVKQQYRIFVLSAIQIKANTLTSSSPSSQYRSMDDSKGYYLQNGVIQYYPTLQIQSKSIKSVNNNLIITACYNDYLLISGMCIKKQYMDENCIEYNPFTSECVRCARGYDMDYIARCQKRSQTSCANRDPANDACLKCADGYFNVGDFCISKRIIMTRDRYHFEVVEQRIMWPLMPNCVEQKEIGKCMTCDVGFANIEGRCLLYQKYCQNYSAYGFCQKCLSGYTLQGSNCIQLNCLRSDSSSSMCSTCSKGFQYQSGKCFPIKQSNCIMYSLTQCIGCQSQYYLSYLSRQCEYSLPNCAVMNPSSSKCSQCNQQYTLYRQSCILQKPNCVEYALDGSCIKCTEIGSVKYQLLRDGSCLKVPSRCTRLSAEGGCELCETGYNLTRIGTGNECVIMRQNCISYDSTGRCSKCAQAYTLRNSKCYFLIANCAQSDQYSRKCTKCISSYSLNDGYCILPDINCKAYKSGYCDSCNNGYHLSVSGSGLCQTNPQNCQIYNIKDKTCLMCNNNYKLIDGQCQQKSIVLNGCVDKNRNEGNCLVCENGFVMRQNVCYANNCLTYTIQRNCKQCPKYYKISNKDSRVCQPHFCSIYSMGTICDVYENDYKGGFVIHGSGRISIQYCMQYNNTNNKCTKCQAYRYPNTVTQYSICYPYNCANENQLKCSNCKPGFVKSDKNDGVCIAQYCQQFENNGACRTCMKPYVKNAQALCVTTGPCLQYDINANTNNSNNIKCKRCQQYYMVVDGQCVAKNCLQQQPDQTQAQTQAQAQVQVYGCNKCKHGFAKTQNNGCKLKYCQIQLLDSFCKVCATGYRRNSVLGICQPQNCQAYDQQTYTCNKCSPNFILAETLCKPKYCKQYKNNTNTNSQCSKCQNGYTPTSTGSCQAQYCLTFNQNRVCIACQNGYLLDDKTNTCMNNSNFCIQYDSNRNCIKCKNGLVLAAQKNCIVQIKMCRNYGPFQCVKCNNGYQLKAGLCKLIGCLKQKDGTNLCQQCMTSYQLTKQGLCRVKNCEMFSQQNWACNSCMGRFSLLKGQCQARNCAMYSVVDQITCLLCEQDYQLVDGGCLHKNCINPKQTNCKACVQGWLPNYKKVCSIRDCQNNDFMTGICTSCKPGKRLSKGLCIGDRCLSRLQNGQCRACDRSFYLINNRKQCVSYFCKIWDNSNGQCQICIDGFALKAGVCVNTLCSRFQDKNALLMPVCVECPDGYYPYNQYCVPKRCTKQGYDPLIGGCSVCEFGFQADSNGVCKLKNCNKFVQNSTDYSQCSTCRLGFTKQAGLCLTTNCIQFQSGTVTCNTCHDGYFLFSDICLATNCHNYGNQGQCTQCQQQFNLLDNLTCVRRNCLVDTLQYCSKCEDGYVSNANTNGYCKPVNCKDINPQTNKCNQCMNGYVKDNQICKDIKCGQYTQYYQCNKCRRGFKMIASTGLCQLQYPSFCPPGQYYNQLKSMCSKISILYCKYVQNNQPNVCIQCMDGYFMQNGLCVSVSGCSKYSIIDGCIECEYGLQLINRRCINSDTNCQLKLDGKCAICRQMYYLNNNKQCVAKPINCVQETADRRCTKCEKGYNMVSELRGCQAANCLQINQQNLRCKQCVSGYVLNKNQICQQSYSNCKTQKNGSCIKCQQQYTLYNKMCVRVIQNCQAYSQTTSQCTKCRQGYIVKNNKCVQEVQGCDVLNQNGGCLICRYGYIKSNDNKCGLAKDYCQEFDNKGACKKCKDGYHLRVDGLCYQNPQFCTEANSMGQCLKCSNGYILGLQNSCFKAVQQAKTVSLQTQTQTSNNDILVVNIGPVENNSQNSKKVIQNTKTTQTQTTKVIAKQKIDQSKISYIDNCLFQDDIKEVCVICNLDYYITETGKCLPLPPNCRYTNFKGICLSCAQGFALKKNQCVEDASSITKPTKTDQLQGFQTIDKATSNLRNQKKV